MSAAAIVPIAGWERIESRGQLVYWRRRLSDRSWLAVSRAHERGIWEWSHYLPNGPRRRVAGGRAVSTITARRLADEYIAGTPECPHRCGPLRWVDDAWYCPKCGDEWPDEVVGAAS